jgi:hypothetical protein
MILDRLKRQIQSVNEHQYSIYNDGLEKVEKISRSIKALIELNKMKISHIDQHSVINNSFNRFHQNFNVRFIRERVKIEFFLFRSYVNNGLIIAILLDIVQIIPLIQYHRHVSLLLLHHLDIIRRIILENDHDLLIGPIDDRMMMMMMMKNIHYLKT